MSKVQYILTVVILSIVATIAEARDRHMPVSNCQGGQCYQMAPTNFSPLSYDNASPAASAYPTATAGSPSWASPIVASSSTFNVTSSDPLSGLPAGSVITSTRVLGDAAIPATAQTSAPPSSGIAQASFTTNSPATQSTVAPTNYVTQTNYVPLRTFAPTMTASPAVMQQAGPAAYGSAQWKAEQCARNGSVAHIGGGFGGGSYEGNGFAATPDQAIRSACFWGQRTPIQIGVARGANGYYATVFYQ